MARAVVRLLLACLLAGCMSGATAQQWAQERVDKAEAEMKACKEFIGLGSAPTPATASLYDPAAGPVAQDPGQVKIKTMCGRQLRELLDARRALGELNR